MSQRRTTRSRRAAVSDFLTRLGRGSERRGTVLAALLALGFLLVLLALLSIPMVRVPSNASAAKNDLTRAKDALAAGDIAGARSAVSSARDHVDAAHGGINGIASHVWGVLPVAGGAVHDARHLVQALDDATSVAEIGARLYPAVAGDRATLFVDGQVDKATLDEVLAGARSAGDHLSSAQRELGDVQGDTPVVGDTIAARRDDAESQVAPLVDGYSEFQPLLAKLPGLLGFEGRRHYLIAMLNPAELRYSGGATLNYAPLMVDNGKLDFGRPVQPNRDPRLRVPFTWNKVHGNRLHHGGPQYIANATFAPSWGISGKELLRAWQESRNRRHNGVIAVDVVALARLVDVTGAISVPGYGEIDSSNLVKTLIGSYDDYYPDASAQDALNRALIPAFQQQLLEGGDFVAKFQALHSAAAGRHLAVYMRDTVVQDALGTMGLTGNLAEPDRDYLGVFTQNTNASKVDYYQRRSVDLDVTLGRNGSADHRLAVTIDNHTPPYAVPGTDPQTGYFTRWSGLSLGVFVPDGARVGDGSVDGQAQHLRVRNFYHQDFVAPKMLLAPDEKATLGMSYRVAKGATIADDGTMTYGLSMDPQGMVNPETVQVTVHLPRGYEPVSLPAGWTSTKNAITLPATALTESQHWEIVAEPAH